MNEHSTILGLHFTWWTWCLETDQVKRSNGRHSDQWSAIGESSPGSRLVHNVTWSIPAQHTRGLLSVFRFASVCVCACLCERQQRQKWEVTVWTQSQILPASNHMFTPYWNVRQLWAYRRVSAYLTMCLLMYVGNCAHPLSPRHQTEPTDKDHCLLVDHPVTDCCVAMCLYTSRLSLHAPTPLQMTHRPIRGLY